MKERLLNNKNSEKEKLFNNINYKKEWEKTLLYKLSRGYLKPSESWKRQLDRIYYRKYNK